MYTNEIREGDLVRAYAAPGLYGDYVEGIVLVATPDWYSILVEREARAGKSVPITIDTLRIRFEPEDTCPGVVKIADREALGLGGQESSLD